ncbi:hypothetical protein Aph01nite_12900 [Acrocarpospora phusangensis]|uniref:Uncharacterized protein n=1 Tax=Acrocarpospora phusangensis TaxID=1070424 RepID=A0A919Q955_9ACTN|nr:hypothetical protein [Acrocarpospora phusangensis]GIH22980.1 hypothetical protein Aph01nite_12900 [Acrocarpospora phusangensis]
MVIDPSAHVSPPHCPVSWCGEGRPVWNKPHGRAHIADLTTIDCGDRAVAALLYRLVDERDPANAWVRVQYGLDLAKPTNVDINPDVASLIADALAMVPFQLMPDFTAALRLGKTTLARETARP